MHVYYCVPKHIHTSMLVVPARQLFYAYNVPVILKKMENLKDLELVSTLHVRDFYAHMKWFMLVCFSMGNLNWVFFHSKFFSFIRRNIYLSQAN